MEQLGISAGKGETRGVSSKKRKRETLEDFRSKLFAVSNACYGKKMDINGVGVSHKLRALFFSVDIKWGRFLAKLLVI